MLARMVMKGVINSLIGKSVLCDVKEIVPRARRNCVESVPENSRPPGFDTLHGHRAKCYV